MFKYVSDVQHLPQWYPGAALPRAAWPQLCLPPESPVGCACADAAIPLAHAGVTAVNRVRGKGPELGSQYEVDRKIMQGVQHKSL